MRLLYNKSGGQVAIPQWTFGISDNEIIVEVNRSLGRIGVWDAKRGLFRVDPALTLSESTLKNKFAVAFTSAHDFGTVKVAGVTRYRFKVRRKCRVFHPSGGVAFSLYAGDEICTAGYGNTGGDYSKLAIRGYKKSGGSWVSVAEGTSCDTDIEIGYCNMKNSTVYGTGY